MADGSAPCGKSATLAGPGARRGISVEAPGCWFGSRAERIRRLRVQRSMAAESTSAPPADAPSVGSSELTNVLDMELLVESAGRRRSGPRHRPAEAWGWPVTQRRRGRGHGRHWITGHWWPFVERPPVWVCGRQRLAPAARPSGVVQRTAGLGTGSRRAACRADDSAGSATTLAVSRLSCAADHTAQDAVRGRQRLEHSGQRPFASGSWVASRARQPSVSRGSSVRATDSRDSASALVASSSSRSSRSHTACLRIWPSTWSTSPPFRCARPRVGRPYRVDPSAGNRPPR